MENYLLQHRSELLAGERCQDFLPVAWFEGLQLLPQHFQANDNYISRLIRRSTRGATAYHWGLDGIEYDPVAIAAGKFRLLRASGQFSDGLLFYFDAREFGPLEFDFSSSIDSDRGVRIALAVPASFCRAGGNMLRRFEQHYGDPIPDLQNAEESAVVARLMPKLLLKPFEMSRGTYVELPVAEILSIGNSFSVSGFHPPATTLIRGSGAHEALLSLVAKLRVAAHKIEGHGLPDTLSSDYANGFGWAFSALVRSLCSLEGVLSDASTHPRAVYVALCEALGNISGLAGRVPTVVAPYDHLDIGGSLQSLCDAIVEAVPPINLAEHDWFATPLSAGSDGVMRVALPPGHRGASVVLMLELDRPDNDGSVIDWIQTVLISGDSELQQCRRLRVKGLPRREVFGIDEMRLLAAPNQKLVIVDGISPNHGNSPVRLAVDAIPPQLTGRIRNIQLVVKNNA